jgi:hypothetical protein
LIESDSARASLADQLKNERRSVEVCLFSLFSLCLGPKQLTMDLRATTEATA